MFVVIGGQLTVNITNNNFSYFIEFYLTTKLIHTAKWVRSLHHSLGPRHLWLPINSHAKFLSINEKQFKLHNVNQVCNKVDFKDIKN